MGEKILVIKLTCAKCGASYFKPAEFLKWSKEWPNTFFKRSLKYCDKHRDKIQKNNTINTDNF
jgi:hypothetical protein